MDYSLVEAYDSARQKERLVAFESVGSQDSETNLKDNLVKVLGCVQKLTANLSVAERQHVDRILGSELCHFLRIFCVDLHVHVRSNDLDNALKRDGPLAAIDTAFDHYDEFKRMLMEAGIW